MRHLKIVALACAAACAIVTVNAAEQELRIAPRPNSTLEKEGRLNAVATQCRAIGEKPDSPAAKTALASFSSSGAKSQAELLRCMGAEFAKDKAVRLGAISVVSACKLASKEISAQLAVSALYDPEAVVRSTATALIPRAQGRTGDRAVASLADGVL